MALETGTYISDLVITNPTADDLKSQGDDHLRLLKSTIKATLPFLVGVVSASDVELSYVKGVTGAIQTQIDTKFAKAGGTITGALTLSPVAAAAQTFLNKPAGTYNSALTGQTAGLARWLLELGTATSETGSNAGSDFALSRYSDAGALIDVPLTVSRATGAVAVSTTLTVPTPTLPTHATTKAYADNLFNAFASAVRLPRQSRTSNVALGVGDVAQFIDCSGTFAQTFSASATLASGWWAWIGNSGTGTITLTPNGAELIDGLASRTISPGERRLIQCDGSTLRTIISSSAVVRRPIFAATSATMNAGSALERIENALFNTGGTSSSVLASNGTNVVCSLGGSGTVSSSPDGRVWTTRSMPIASTYGGLATDGSGFLAINIASGTTAYSATGASWVAATDRPALTNVGAFTLAGLSSGRYVANSSSSTSLYLTINNGTTWTTETGPSTSPGLWSSAGFFVAWNPGSNTYYTSTTGTTGSWTTRTLPGGLTKMLLDLDGSMLSYDTSTLAKIWRCTDGINWTQSAVALPVIPGMLFTINGILCCGSTAAHAFWTLHNSKWSPRNIGYTASTTVAPVRHLAANLFQISAAGQVMLIDPTATDAATGLFD